MQLAYLFDICYNMYTLRKIDISSNNLWCSFNILFAMVF